MELYIYATRDLHDTKPHIFYSEDFTDSDIGNEYEVLKPFFVDYAEPDDYDFYSDFIQKVDGKDSIVIPKGTIITIDDIENDGSFCFESEGLKFCIPKEIDTPMYLRCLDTALVACDINAADYIDYNWDDEESEYDEDYNPNDYYQHSEEWYIARDRGEDTEPF